MAIEKKTDMAKEVISEGYMLPERSSLWLGVLSSILEGRPVLPYIAKLSKC